MPEGLKCVHGRVYENTESDGIDFGTLVGFLHCPVSIFTQQLCCPLLQ